MAVSAIASYFSCGLVSNGTGNVYCWGANSYGMLGDLTTNTLSRPTRTLIVPNTTRVVQVSTGEQFVCILSDIFAVRCWGYNIYGQLGDGTTTTRSNTIGPVVFSNVAKIAAGYMHVCVLSRLEPVVQVYCWGFNNKGQMGNGNVGFAQTTPVMASVRGPQWVTDICSGFSHTCVLFANRTVWCWGDNALGQLGSVTTASMSAHPLPVSIPGSVAQLSCGAFTNCVTLVDGDVYCWGDNSKGQFGDGTTVWSAVPRRASLLANLGPVRMVATGYGSSCAALVTKAVYCYGLNSNGQLGQGTVTSLTKASPDLPNTFPSSADVRQASCGSNFCCALAGATQTVSCWGSNGGYIGNGYPSGAAVAVPVAVRQGVLSVGTGNEHTCVLLAGGTVQCWGSNGYGQLGVPPSTFSVTLASLALPVTGLQNVVQLASGTDFNCVVNTSGLVQCWGSNRQGQLGINSLLSNFYEPMTVLDLGTVSQVSCGNTQTCAVLTNGDLRCWGGNSQGQQGVGNTTNLLRPGPVILTRVAEVAPSTSFTCALLINGTVLCWGSDLYGQLGDGPSSVNRLVPVFVRLTAPATRLFARFSQAFAFLETGNIAAWGLNSAGMLGDRTTTNRFVPINLNISGYKSLAVGSTQTCGIANDGSMRCWGSNTEGQLGDLTGLILTPSLVPGIDL
jgi:alpha-tubulin suppressor-like RCC1 family protein